MFSKTCEYAIRAMLFIAQKSREGQKVGIRAIAKNIASPEHFIAKILQDLSRKGLLQSAKGPNGGFYLEDKDFKRSIAEIVVAVDGDRIFTGCGLGLRECSAAKPCPIHHEFKKIREQLTKTLSRASIDSFAAILDSSEAFLKR
jgi:Rrf2 family protein